MWDWISDHAWVGWTGVATALAVLELLSLDLVLLMFAVAAVVAAVAAAVGAPAWATFLIFGGVSIVLLAFVRPRALARLHRGPTLSVGHHNLVGRTATVDEPVSVDAGRVLLDGTLWTARATDPHAVFDIGQKVVVTAIDGATAQVARPQESEWKP